MGKTRMYEPYGYLEEGEYISKKSMLYNELQKNRDNDHKEFKDINDLYEKHNTEAVNSAYYDDDLESVIFKNVKGEAISSIKMKKPSSSMSISMTPLLFCHYSMISSKRQ